MSENQPFNNSSFNPASNSAFDKSQPIQGQAAPAPAAVAPVVMQPVKSTGIAYVLWFFLGGVGDPQVLPESDGSGCAVPVSIFGWVARSFYYYWGNSVVCVGHSDDY
ncbi:Uncharacterised protein [Rothia aeria]|uniref:Uncharacterized protein n=1 Tax=Rothia aeria TaxID=172042 RepID=A0A7Z9A5G6_9MICC|nr:TM2 domain-containing protein [Rothia aeria]VEI25092.1 Uncharacterised protein [Rothia aeria]